MIPWVIICHHAIIILLTGNSNTPKPTMRGIKNCGTIWSVIFLNLHKLQFIWIWSLHATADMRLKPSQISFHERLQHVWDIIEKGGDYIFLLNRFKGLWWMLNKARGYEVCQETCLVRNRKYAIFSLILVTSKILNYFPWHFFDFLFQL